MEKRLAAGARRHRRRQDQGHRLHGEVEPPRPAAAASTMPAPRPAMRARHRAPRHRQVVRRGPRQPRHLARRARRHDPRHRRRERRRQVDADGHPLRATTGPIAARSSCAGGPSRSGAPRMRWRRASAWCTSTSCWWSRSPCWRTWCSAWRAGSGSARGSRGRAPSSRGSAREYHLEVDPDARVGRSRRRAAPARRDPEGALPRRRSPDPRRAHRRAHAARRPITSSAILGALRDAGQDRACSSPTSCARSARSPTSSR